MNDRIPTKPGRVKLTPVGNDFFILERADEPTEEGTPLNKATLLNSENETRYNAETPNDALTAIGRVSELTIPADGWSPQPNAEGYYIRNVSVSWMRENFYPQMQLRTGTAAEIDDQTENYNLIKKVITANGMLVFCAESVPQNDINVIITGA